MKKSKSILIITIGIFWLFQSCTIEKRHFRPGYYIEWKQNPFQNHSDEKLSSKSQSEINYEYNNLQIDSMLFEGRVQSQESPDIDSINVNQFLLDKSNFFSQENFRNDNRLDGYNVIDISEGEDKTKISRSLNEGELLQKCEMVNSKNYDDPALKCFNLDQINLETNGRKEMYENDSTVKNQLKGNHKGARIIFVILGILLLIIAIGSGGTAVGAILGGIGILCFIIAFILKLSSGTKTKKDQVELEKRGWLFSIIGISSMAVGILGFLCAVTLATDLFFFFLAFISVACMFAGILFGILGLIIGVTILTRSKKNKEEKPVGKLAFWSIFLSLLTMIGFTLALLFI